MSTLMLWFLALVVFATVAVTAVLHNRVRSARLSDRLIPAGVYLLSGVALVLGTFYGARGIATADTELLNGSITGKDRVHGSYQRSYECNCSESCSGSGSSRSCRRSCQTCYEDHYTVKWTASSTVGGFLIDSADWTNRGAYLLPNPPRWNEVRIGEPASREHTYTNYVQAVPESLFHATSKEVRDRFAALIPTYPRTFDFYRANRFLTPGFSVPDALDWNVGISELLRERGPRKQVNVIVVLVKTADAAYAEALRDAWAGAKKNDVVLVLGASQYPKLDFVSVLSWTKNELFKIQLRDNIFALGVVQREPILGIIASQIDTNFERRHMAEFKYLEEEIDPPTWLLALLAIVIIGSAGGIMYYVRSRT